MGSPEKREDLELKRGSELEIKAERDKVVSRLEKAGIGGH